MAWFKVDDGLHSSRKLMSIPKRGRFAAVGVWAVAGSWAAGELTDGFIPDYMLTSWGIPPSASSALVEAGLWERTSGGYLFCNWSEYQPRKEDVDAERAASRERMRDLRARRKQRKPQKDAEEPEVFGRTVANGSENVRNPDPTRPDPTRPSISNEIENSSSGAADAAPRPDVERLLDLLDTEIKANGGKVRQRTQKNRDAMRLLLDRDGRTADQIATAIHWCQTDEFWRSNILSASKLREKYDQLRLAAQRSPRTPGVSKAEERQHHNLGVVNQLAALDAAEQRGIEQ